MNKFVTLPFYAKVSLIFIGLFAFVSMLFVAQRIIVPVIYSTIIAIVLNPIVSFLQRKGMNRVIAITLTVLSIITVSISLIVLLYSQASTLGDSFPKLVGEFHALLSRFVIWSAATFNTDTSRINSWIVEARQMIMDGRMSMLRQTLVGAGSFLIVLVLMPVYIFMILYYRPLLLEFIHRLFSQGKHNEVNEVLSATKSIIQSYLVGLLLESVIIATLNASSLLIIGIDYAILLGVIGAVCNIVPYVGGIIGVSFPVMIALVTKQSFSYALLIIGAYMIIQFVDNHYIMPKIVASKVKINALVSVVVVLLGGALWGIPGMFLSIPLTAIIKVIFDHIESLKPWGFLLGDTMPAELKSGFRFKRRTFKKINISVN